MALPGFSLFSTMHLSYLAAWLLVWLVVPWIGLRFLHFRARFKVAVLLATITVVQEAVDYLNRMSVRDLSLAVDLPLQFCHLAQIFSVLLLFLRNPLLFEVTYFWGIIAGSQAMLTPDMNAFDDYLTLFLFFMHHGLVILIVVWLVFVSGCRCRPRAVMRTFLITNLVMIPVALIDWAIDANYMYLRASPVTDSPFITFGWPWYILEIEAIGLLMMCLLQLPMMLARRRETVAAR